MRSNILNKLKKIIIFTVIIILIMQSVSFADFTEQQQTLIKGFVSTVKTYNTGYTVSDTNALNLGYQLKETEGSYDQRGYRGVHIWLCCATWISTIYNRCFNIEIANRDATDGYATPDGWINPQFKKITEDELECGDLVFWDVTTVDGKQYYGHMGMYLGDDTVTDCSPNIYPSYGNGSNVHGGVYVRDFWKGDLYLRYASDAVSSDGALQPGGVINSVIQAVKDWVYQKVPFRTANEGSIDKDKVFEYQGIAKLESEETQVVENSWRFPVISDLLEWLLNFVCTIIKSIFVGFATLVQVLITFYMDAASGEEVNTRLSSGMMAYFTSGGLQEDIANSVTMEKIIYNQVPLLDVDVFNGNVAGGKTLDSSSLVVIIRNLVASFYLAIRKVSLIILLLVLIYYGIKFVTTGIAEEKAEYKQKLLSWAIAFMIVFGLHYFLIAVMKINEIAVNLFKNVGTNIASAVSGGEYFELATAMRELTYQTGLVKSFVATCLYMAMVYYLVKFIIIYFKRLFITLILIILAPFMGIKFAVDKLKFKQSSSLTTWAKEYIFSVGTQTIHALVYTIFVGLTYNMVLNIDTAKMAVCVLAFMFFRFMTEAEKLLRKFLKLSGDSAKSIMGDAQSTDIKDIVGWTILARMTRYTDAIGVPSMMKNKYSNSKKFVRHHFENEYVKMMKNEYIEKYYEAYRPNARGLERKATSDVDKQIEQALKLEFRHKIGSFLDSVDSSWSMAKNAGKIAVGIPIGIVENTLVGTSLAVTGAHTLITALGGKIRGFKTPTQIEKYRAQNGTYNNIQKWIKANATYKVSEEFRKQYLHANDDTLAAGQAQLALLHEARRVELDLQNEIANQKDKLLKGIDGAKPATKLEKKLAETYAKKLRQKIEDAMKTIDRKDIQEHVKAYMKKHHKYSLTMADFAIIADELDVKDIHSEILKDFVDLAGITDNIKAETMARFISEITEQDGIGNKITLDTDVMDDVENNIKTKMIKEKDPVEKQNLLNAIKCIDDKRHELAGKPKLNVYSNLSPTEQSKVKGIIEDATDDKAIEKQVTRLNAEQIVDTMKNAADRQGSIKQEHPTYKIREFEPIMEQIQKFRELNELAREKNEEPLHYDVAQIVDNMMKNPKINKP